MTSRQPPALRRSAAVTGLALLGLTLAASSARDTTPAAHSRKPLPSPEEIAMLPPDGGTEYNRLIHEKSPYLLQHARNPVDWYPWGAEAFDRARRENKPVFLSVGYSTCHWCHVMERESFERTDVADILNAHFVSIKVDREERPDVDEIYMTATQLMTGRGGWPNSLWLTPDRRPWFAGTYFPREDQGGHIGFKTLLGRLADAWRTRRTDVDRQAEQLAGALKQAASGQRFDDAAPLTREVVAGAIADLRDTFDATHGGFGGAPKFPPHASLRLLLYEYERTRDADLLPLVTRTLDAMAAGGIHDHAGGGFHRYATDAHWFLPHFEKMLYDNAQLVRVYVDAHRLTGHADYRRVAVNALEWVLRDMTSPEGAFYSALDADSEGEEGKFYVWRPEELREVLGEETGERFGRLFGVRPDGNFREEATGEKPGTNILFLAKPIAELADSEKQSADELRAFVDACRVKLLERRNQRVWPHLDDKVLASWNGLMIGALAHAGRHLNEPRYTQAAERAAEFVLTRMRKQGRLLRTSRDGQAKLNAYLDDYALVAEGLLDLHRATGVARWSDEARALVDTLLEHHWDGQGGGFYFVSADHEELLTRTKDPFDQAVPSGNGVAALVLLDLADGGYRDKAKATLDAFSGYMRQAPRGTASLALAAARFFDRLAASQPAKAESAKNAAASKPDAQSQEGPVKVEAYFSHDRIAPGATLHVALRLTLEEGWHVNSHKPLDANLTPTTVTVQPNAALAPGPVAYPKANHIQLGDRPATVYAGATWLPFSVTIAADAQPGRVELTVIVQTQPCDATRCLQPQTHTLSARVTIAKDGPTPDQRHRELFGTLGLGVR